MMGQTKNWVFTLNNPENDDVPRVWAGQCSFISWQREVGENGTPHLQGTLVLINKKTLGGMKKLNGQCHWDVRKGNIKQAVDYCEKQETRVAGPWRVGEMPACGAGGRTDLLELKAAIDEGKSDKELCEDYFASMSRVSRFVSWYRSLDKQKNRNWITFTTVLWGLPGTGKTRAATALGGDDAYWLMKPGGMQTIFFDGYDGQEIVVIDEFYGWIPYDLLCRLCDSSPLRVQTKGGSVSFRPKRIIITSNRHPNEWYKYDKFLYGPLERRLSGMHGEIILFDRPMEVRATAAVPNPSTATSLPTAVNSGEIREAPASSLALRLQVLPEPLIQSQNESNEVDAPLAVSIGVETMSRSEAIRENSLKRARGKGEEALDELYGGLGGFGSANSDSFVHVELPLNLKKKK